MKKSNVLWLWFLMFIQCQIILFLYVLNLISFELSILIVISVGFCLLILKKDKDDS